jgi:hypothetical protein
MDDLQDIQEALQENKEEEEKFAQTYSEFAALESEEITAEDLVESSDALPSSLEEEPIQEIDPDLEAKMQEELRRKQEAEKSQEISREDFIQYLGQKRTKIIYHALWFLVFNVDDNQTSKKMLYEQLKDVTSKNPVEPLGEHKFYFGLGFILRLKYEGQILVKFKAGKLTVIGNVVALKEILRIVGDPISERPILTEREKSKMFTDFLSDDFDDI